MEGGVGRPGAPFHRASAVASADLPPWLPPTRPPVRSGEDRSSDPPGPTDRPTPCFRRASAVASADLPPHPLHSPSGAHFHRASAVASADIPPWLPPTRPPVRSGEDLSSDPLGPTDRPTPCFRRASAVASADLPPPPPLHRPSVWVRSRSRRWCQKPGQNARPASASDACTSPLCTSCAIGVGQSAVLCQLSGRVYFLLALASIPALGPAKGQARLRMRIGTLRWAIDWAAFVIPRRLSEHQNLALADPLSCEAPCGTSCG